VLIPGGGIPMLLFAAIKGHAVDDAPVINGIPIVVKMAELAVKLRQLTGLGRQPGIGLRQSPAGDHRGISDQSERAFRKFTCRSSPRRRGPSSGFPLPRE